MSSYRLFSDQLYTWSDRNTWPDRNEETNDCRFAKTPPSATAPTTPACRHPAGLAYRALQTLWQARMQVRQRSWSRPQVLSVGELPGLAPANGLRTTGRLQADQRVVGQLPAGPRHLRESVRDQPRTAAPPRGALTNCHERYACFARPSFRCAIGWRAPRQHARGMAGRRAILAGNCGGNR